MIAAPPASNSFSPPHRSIPKAPSMASSRDPPLFRAPPPSPAAAPRTTSPESLEEDDDFSRFLKRSRRVPELILPHRNPPEIDLGSLIGGSDEEDLRSAARSVGCFQIVNHWVKGGVIEAAIEAAEGVFGVPEERRKVAARSPERKWGFEVEEEGDFDEFFWWSSSGAEEMAGVLPQVYDDFSGKMEQLLMKIEKIARKIEHILMDSTQQYNINDSLKWRKDVTNNMIICLRKHKHKQKRSKETNFIEEEGIASFDLNQDMLGGFIRSLGSSHALCFHLFIGASRFRVYSKQAQLSFRPADAAIVVTIGDQMQEKSSGIYRQVIGKPEYQYVEAQKEPISIAFLHSYTAVSTQASVSSSKAGAEKEKENIISISKQLIMAACFLLFYHLITYVCFAKV